jgi:hypothetical protein
MHRKKPPVCDTGKKRTAHRKLRGRKEGGTTAKEIRAKIPPTPPTRAKRKGGLGEGDVLTPGQENKRRTAQRGSIKK